MQAVNTSYYLPYLDALRAADSAAAGQVIEAARAAGLSNAEIYLGIMEPALVEVGEMWQRGELTVAQEHRASSITEALIAQVHRSAPVVHGSRLLLAAVYPNQHHIGVRMVQSLFEQSGWTVRNLGASVLTAELKHHTRVFKPHLVGLSAALFTQLPALKATIHILKARWPNIPILIGGGAVKCNPQVLQEVGADYAANNALEGLRLAEAMIIRSRHVG